MDQVVPPAPGSRLIQAWDGLDYERHSSQQRAWGGDLIAELALRGDERILDLGCGDGTLTARLAGLVPSGSVLGIDAAPEMLEAAQGKCGPNMRVAVCDIRRLDFVGEFDLIFSNATLHWVPDHAAVLARIHRALRPGGILRAQFGADGNVPNFLAGVRRQMAEPPYREALAAFRWPWFFPGLPDYEALLAASPLAEWRAWIEPKAARFPTAEAIVGWIDNPCLIPFVQALPPGLRQPFRDAVVAGMLARTRQPDGSFQEPFRRMNVWARKASDPSDPAV
jgi:trans-aconitate methyltransferase